MNRLANIKRTIPFNSEYISYNKLIRKYNYNEKFYFMVNPYVQPRIIKFVDIYPDISRSILLYINNNKFIECYDFIYILISNKFLVYVQPDITFNFGEKNEKIYQLHLDLMSHITKLNNYYMRNKRFDLVYTNFRNPYR